MAGGIALSKVLKLTLQLGGGMQLTTLIIHAHAHAHRHIQTHTTSGDMGLEHVALSERADEYLPHSLMRTLLLLLLLLPLLLLMMMESAAAAAAVCRLGLRGVSSQASKMTECCASTRCYSVDVHFGAPAQTCPLYLSD